MGLPIYRHKELPRRFPVGAKYVVEGYGGEEGSLRIIARYIVLPSGRRINVPRRSSDSGGAPRTCVPPPGQRQTGECQTIRAKIDQRAAARKFAARRGTG